MKAFLGGVSAAVVAVAVVGAPSVASAATYVSNLEYRDGSNSAYVPPFGTVTIEDGLDGGDRVRVTVAFTNSLTEFVETGNDNHYPFAFNLFDAVDSDVNIVTGVGPDWDYLGVSLYKVSGFTNGSAASKFTNAIVCCGGTGGANGVLGSMSFDVTNNDGITFAGIGATFDVNGRLLTTGSGNRFKSTSLGWWFAADIWDADTGQTYNVAARDAFRVGVVPEPGTWALMILGFGGAGAMLRRRRTALA